MEKEQYIPSLEEVKKAEEMMTIDQKHFSEYRDEMNHAKRLAEEYQKMNTPQQNLFIRKMLPPEGGYPPSEYGFSVGGINVNKENYKLFYELQEYDLDFWKMHYGDLDTTIECVRISDDGYGQDKVSFEEMLNTIGSTAILSMLGSLILRGSSSEFNGYKIWFKKRSDINEDDLDEKNASKNAELKKKMEILSQVPDNIKGMYLRSKSADFNPTPTEKEILQGIEDKIKK